ncbi:tRNA (N(6)-L-threonylcarbamoyladenosine(37)-C(2))-methylthiotransferase [Candidatus Woesearchaeota archaeon]|nr:tRNA (N(6)-L-threonylcarbamoyladenosine(37)-C(2))-methylthiotransferase [Candidatus Woesearchaeota archaeon]
MNIYVRTFGCSANIAESEMMAGLLGQEHTIVTELSCADLVLVNACTVKGDFTVLREIRKIKQQYPRLRLVIAGCLSPSLRQRVTAIDHKTSFLNTHHVHNVCQVVSAKEPVQILSLNKKPKLALPRQRKNNAIAIIPISNGCLDHCSYCSTKLIKGQLVSYPIPLICQEVSNAIADGCSMIWITSQDTSCYGKDRNSTIIELLEHILDIPGEFTVRLGMGNPTYFKEMIPELVEILHHPKMFKFLHVPVQSGSNRVLQMMNRAYSVEDCQRLINTLRVSVPRISLATDIITGFPGETENDFEHTLRLLQETPFDTVNISRFVPRKGTQAYTMKKQITGSEKKQRSRAVTTIVHTNSKQLHDLWLDWKGEVIVEEQGKEETSIARNMSYKQLIIPGHHTPGSRLCVRVTESTVHHLKAELVP